MVNDEMCKAIQAGTSMNVIEIDAASNNGVDNIREIREEVAYRPTEGNYKVYIIDEVHMLSTGAFNAHSENTGGTSVLCYLHSLLPQRHTRYQSPFYPDASDTIFIVLP